MNIVQYYGTGKRKTSIARVFLREGSGKVMVNNRELHEYFPMVALQNIARSPLALTNLIDKFDAFITTKGGGISAQADAIKLGISRALEKFNPELRKILKDNKMLTRDSREKERKKYGQPGARKRFQYSKR
ncbi:MAG: 30S ribosomal protein S9 [Candidatus Fischerbacteria bacterium RBG_13_37_8]|uniref:Small ribosomal subunit protein uS9 n=1 Tax=Candidatus Fischerbacteria bacterium RBG_13_37_8 TaxID=1817863 RepID=A0A1F5VH63_9BACT|nr:MAG: 30S ribosomal protein S9 [Candidatus Fischerbacteria bacterium RBG_13_37_8]